MQAILSHAFERRDFPPDLGADEIHLWFLTAVGSARPHSGAAANRAVADLLTFYAGTGSLPALRLGARGKPHMAGPDRIEFNISHSGQWALLAFAREQPLGVDLERLDRRQRFGELARRYFTPGEADAIGASPVERRAEAFLRLWTCKEALLKALGTGLGFGLDRLAFSIDAEGFPEALKSLAAEGGNVGDWQLCALAPAPALVGALAWRGPTRHVRAMQWPDDAARSESCPLMSVHRDCVGE